MPLTLSSDDGYECVFEGDELYIDDLFEGFERGTVTVKNLTSGREFACNVSFTKRQKDILKAGGLLAYTKQTSGT